MRLTSDLTSYGSFPDLLGALLPFEDLPKTPLLDLLPSVSLVGNDVLTDALADLGNSAAAFADLVLVRVSDVGDDVP